MTDTVFRFATAGSVDDGKSTLVGRLLHDAKAILVDQLDQVSRTSAERGFEGIDFALLTDGLRAEREQGITIDVAYRYFSTGTRSFILADCPGHVQYTRNMVTGATTADAVVVLIDGRKGVLEQTRRHLAVVALLRVPHVIVAVNKIDLLDFAETAYRPVAEQVTEVAAELGIDAVHVIPVSALAGDNVVDRSDRTPWYGGPALLELLESLQPAAEITDDEPFRLSVQTVLRPQGGLAAGLAEQAEQYRDYRAAAGRIGSGRIRVGDRVRVISASGHAVGTSVTGLSSAGRVVDEAFAPQSVAIELADDIDAARGSSIIAEQLHLAPTKLIDAELFVLDSRPLTVGARLLVKHGTQTVQGIVASIDAKRDLDTLGYQPADTLQVNEIGHATIKLASEIVAEQYVTDRNTGSFLLIHPGDGNTLAAGIIRSTGTGNQ